MLHTHKKMLLLTLNLLFGKNATFYIATSWNYIFLNTWLFISLHFWQITVCGGYKL